MYSCDCEEQDNFHHYNFSIYINLISRFLSVDIFPELGDHIDCRNRINSFILFFFNSTRVCVIKLLKGLHYCRSPYPKQQWLHSLLNSTSISSSKSNSLMRATKSSD